MSEKKKQPGSNRDTSPQPVTLPNPQQSRPKPTPMPSKGKSIPLSEGDLKTKKLVER